jgi:peptidoglycan/LPS O-acetylase OafA/YrhL
VGGDTLAPIHGLRFLSMIWVILGHSCIVIFKYSDNTDFRGVVEREFFFQTISNAAFSVDTFFFISGLLFSFLYFRTTAKVDLNKITRATGLKSKVLQFIGLLGYRFSRYGKKPILK